MDLPKLRPVLMAFLAGLGFCAGPGLYAFTNGDFEAGSTAGWTLDYGFGSTPATINVVSGGFAPLTNNNLNRVDQGSYSCELYSGNGGSGTTYARISQSDLITASNSVLQFRYAGVLDGSHASTPLSDASVVVMVSSTTTVIYQGTYRYASSPAALVDDGVPVQKHLPWTTINIDLTAYIGTTVTFSFAAVDCLGGAHSCYAYVDGFILLAPTPTPTITPTATASPTETPTFTITPSFSESPTVTTTPTLTASPSITSTFSESPTATMTPTATPSFTQTKSVTASHTPTITLTATPTPLPLLLKLYPPNPNPAVEEMWIPYNLSVDADVHIQVWTVAGELARSLHPGWRLSGANEDVWDLKNEAGNNVSSGIYIYRVQAAAGDEKQQDYRKCAVAR